MFQVTWLVSTVERSLLQEKSSSSTLEFVDENVSGWHNDAIFKSLNRTKITWPVGSRLIIFFLSSSQPIFLIFKYYLKKPNWNEFLVRPSKAKQPL